MFYIIVANTAKDPTNAAPTIGKPTAADSGSISLAHYKQNHNISLNRKHICD